MFKHKKSIKSWDDLELEEKEKFKDPLLFF